MPTTMMYGVTLTVEAALSASTGTYGVWGAGLWGSATWGPDILWTDISPYVVSAQVTRRFGRGVATWEAGTASVVLRNEDGRFSPENAAGPYVVAGVTGIRPWRPIRIRATYAGVTYDLYRGYILAWMEEWIQAYPGGGGARVTVPCTDEMGRLAGWSGYATTSQGAGESTGSRVHRILDAAGHTGMRDVDVGRMTVQATDLSGDAASQLKLVADSEGGAVYVDTDGTIVFDAYTALLESPRSNTVQRTWGDTAGALPYSDIATEYNGDNLINIAAFSRSGGTTQVVADNTSRSLYQDRQYARSDLATETDLQVQALAGLTVALRSTPERRITSIQVKPRGRPDTLFAAVLDARVRDLWRVQRTPPGGYSINQLVHVTGITHNITGDNWVSGFEFASASLYQGFSSSRWDAGSWDSAVWFY